MKKILLAMCLSMAVVLVVTPASAKELWFLHLAGIEEGLAAGALPPAGFYFIDDNYIVPFTYHNDQGNATNTKLFAYINVPVLLWVPGFKVLGADYGVGLAQPFDYTNLRIQTQGGASGVPGLNQFDGGAQWGTFNTVVVPYILSWKLPCDFRIKTAFSVAFDNADTSPQDRVIAYDPVTHQKYAQSYNPDGGIYAESGNGNYMFTPEIGISWLHKGWNISAGFFYTINTKDTVTNYQSGDQFAADYTITYTYGKWTFGAGAAQRNQVFADQFVVPTAAGGNGRYQSQPGTITEEYSAGPIVGYNFGPCSLMFVYSFPIYARNDTWGEYCDLRLVMPLGNLFGGK